MSEERDIVTLINERVRPGPRFTDAEWDQFEREFDRITWPEIAALTVAGAVAVGAIVWWLA